MADRAAEVLERLADELEAHLNRLRTVQKLVAEDPALATKLAESLVQPRVNGRMRPDRVDQPVDNPNLDTILEVFRSRKGEWLTTTQLKEITGIHRGKIDFLLAYSRHAPMFEFYLEHARKKFWRLKEEHMSPDQPKAGQNQKAASSAKKPAKKATTKTPEPEPEQAEPKKIIRPKWCPDAEYIEIEGGVTRRIK